MSSSLTRLVPQRARQEHGELAGHLSLLTASPRGQHGLPSQVAVSALALLQKHAFRRAWEEAAGLLLKDTALGTFCILWGFAVFCLDIDGKGRPENVEGTHSSEHIIQTHTHICISNFLFKISSALAGVAQWIERWPANQRVTGSIPSQGTSLGAGPQ